MEACPWPSIILTVHPRAAAASFTPLPIRSQPSAAAAQRIAAIVFDFAIGGLVVGPSNVVNCSAAVAAVLKGARSKVPEVCAVEAPPQAVATNAMTLTANPNRYQLR